jgi:hypothetical protein
MTEDDGNDISDNGDNDNDVDFNKADNGDVPDSLL